MSSLPALGVQDSMVQLPGGRFWMGSGSLEQRDEEQPGREVTVKPFAIDKYPVTNREFRWERVRLHSALGGTWGLGLGLGGCLGPMPMPGCSQHFLRAKACVRQ